MILFISYNWYDDNDNEKHMIACNYLRTVKAFYNSFPYKIMWKTYDHMFNVCECISCKGMKGSECDGTECNT